MVMQAFGIFEGGGAKGLAHVGALKAVEGRVSFLGLAGSSAGAIAAALVAAGYTADELYNPKTGSGILNIDYPYLLRRGWWDEWKKFAADFKQTFCNVSMKRAWAYSLLFYLRNCQVLDRIEERHGVFETDLLESWINDRLLQKLKSTKQIAPTVECVLFKHLAMPLKLVASNISRQNVTTFSQELTPEHQVAKAVVASASLPFFFIPTKTPEGHFLLDGGLLSNFPAWLFDAERRKFGPLTPTLGFRLVPELPQESACAPSFSGRLAYAVLAGDAGLEIREIENLQEIPLKVRVDTTNFDLTTQEKTALYSSGFEGARNYLISVYGPKDPTEMSAVLELACTRLLEVIGKPATTHLRANIVRETTRGTLRVTYGYNMDSDADDRLEFEIGSGACGLCWESKKVVACDLSEARKTYVTDWKMDKYQQALVRQDLSSLLSIPMFPPHWREGNMTSLSIVGVLNFDSNQDLSADFQRLDLYPRFLEIGDYVAEAMQEEALT
jgi:NTE family protein